VNRALISLICGALLVLLVGLGQAYDPAIAAVLGVVFAATAVAFQLYPRRGKRLVAVYFPIQLLLGYVLFGAAGGGVGSQLLLLVLVIQAALLLPFPLAVAVTLLIPLAHVGMSWTAGLREAISTFVAALFALVLTLLHVRERRARTEVAEANERLRRYAAEVAELSAAKERNRVARDIHDGLGHHLTVVQMQVQAARAVLGSDPDRADAVLAKAQDSATAALAEVRRSVAALRAERPRPPLRAALEALGKQSGSVDVTEEDYKGAHLVTFVFDLEHESKLPAPLPATSLSYAIKDDLLVIGVDASFTKTVLDTDAGNSLATASTYSRALDFVSGRNNAGAVFVDLPVAGTVLDKVYASDEYAGKQFTDVRKYIDPLDDAAVVVLYDGGIQTVRFMLNTRDLH